MYTLDKFLPEEKFGKFISSLHVCTMANNYYALLYSLCTYIHNIFFFTYITLGPLIWGFDNMKTLLQSLVWK